jgi:hypothetical protein
MRHGLITASAAALVIAASCATASATEESAPIRPLVPDSSVQLQPAPIIRSPETTGTLSKSQSATEAAKVDSDARRVTGSVGRTLERMEQMFRTAVP